MIRFSLFLIGLLWASAASAQGLDGRAERLLEEQLSGPGRVVEITGFEGALSTRARFERMTMSDGEGVWLVLENAVLDWTASALLRGRLQVDELSATRLELRRAPVSEIDPVASSEASGFRLPDLPVAIEIGRAALDEISLGAPFLGTAVLAQFEGAAKLEDGGLDLDIQAQRLDGPGGTADIALRFAPGTEVLAINADIREPAGGVLARALDLPGLPSVEFVIAGDGTLDDFASTLRLATDGEERFGGAITLALTDTRGRAFGVDLSGDIRPLLGQENRAFFGSNSEISARGHALPDGIIELDALQIDTAQLTLSGSAALDAAGAPSRIALRGDARGDMPGGAVSFDQARLSLDFDAANGPDWTMAVIGDAVRFAGGQITQAALQGQGVLQPGTDAPFVGQISVTTDGLQLDDTALSDALGPNLTLDTRLSVTEANGFEISELQLTSAHLTGTGGITAKTAEGRIDLVAELGLNVPDIGALGALANPVQAGMAQLEMSLTANLPGGAMTVSLQGETQGLDIGQDVLIPLLEPNTDLTLRLTRDETGTRIETLRLENSALLVTAAGDLSTQDGGLELDGVLYEPRALVPDLPEGSVRLSGRVDNVVTQPAATLTVTHDAGLTADLTATLDGENVAFDVTAGSPSLTLFSAVLGPVEKGSVQARVSGTANTSSGVVDAQIEARTEDLSIGVPDLLPLLEPETTLTAQITRSADGQIDLTPVTLSNPELTAQATGRLTDSGPEFVDLTAELRRPGLFVPDLPSGALSLTGRVDGFDALPRAAFQVRHAAGPVVSLAATLDGTQVAFDTELSANTLRPFAQLLAPVTAGSVQASAKGQADIETGAVTAQISARTGGLATSIPTIAPLVQPVTTLTASVERGADGRLAISDLSAQSTALTASGTAEISSAGDLQAQISAALTDLGMIVPDLPGRLAVTASLDKDRVTADLTSANGTTAQVAGRIGLPNGAVDLTTTGRAPLALANPFLSGRTLSGSAAFDLTLRGTPGLSALSGQVTSGDLRIADAELGLILSPATARIALANERAQITLQGALNDAPLEIRGGVALAGGYQTDISVALRGLDYAFEDFARLNLSADVTLSGPATQRLAIAGDVRLGRSEIRVPDGIGGVAPPPPVRHVGASAAVRQTLDRAGFSEVPSSPSDSGLRLPLDLTIRALEPIFVRGRGLDAEFGGEFLLRGTVSNPVPTGQFSLRRGRLSLLGQRLDLTQGEITATGGLIPELNIIATSETDTITAQVEITGPADAPDLTLSSQPELPQDEVLAQLLFGRDVASLSAFQVAQLVASLASLTTGRPTLLDQSRSAFGVDDLDIRTDATTGEAELAIGNYISENIYSEVEIGAQGDTQINLNLDLTDNTKLRGSVNSDGGTGVGVFWERDY